MVKWAIYSSKQLSILHTNSLISMQTHCQIW
nr:MAG TPA: hypothetical protein [Caudoviricetes sp.]